MLLVLSVVSKVKAQESYDQRVKDYIEHYKDWAMEEQRRSGVPAAITLAQGIHETSAGTSELALNANNHFGIKCKKEWTGETYAYTDDAPDECFRKYPSAFQSYKDHSDYLAGSQRYSALFKLSAKDYSGWCVGLKRCGYATNPKYSQILIKLIEEYNLQQYTYAALSDDYNPVKSAAQQEKKTAGVSQVIPSAQTTSTMSDIPVNI
jgi:flagellum-specific peptidoglycan hydrolase FlgJ